MLISTPCITARRRRRVAVALAVVVAAMALACVPSGIPSTTSYTYHVRQTALAPAASGPHATGPLVPGGSIAFEGSVSGTTVEPVGTSPQGSSTLAPSVTGRVRVTGNIRDRVELGGEVEFAGTDWALLHPNSVPQDDPSNAMYVGVEMHTRVLVAGTPRLGLGVNLEAGFAAVPVLRVVDTTTTTTLGSSPSSVDTTTYRVGATAAGFNGRFGLFGVGQPVRGLSVLGGALVQMLPVAAPSGTAMTTCTNDGTMFFSSCSGTSPDSLPLVGATAAASLWLSAGYTMGVATLFGEIHASAYFDPAITGAAPFGGLVGIRLTVPVTVAAQHRAAHPDDEPRAPAQPPAPARPAEATPDDRPVNSRGP